VWNSLPKRSKVNLVPQLVNIIREKLTDHYYVAMYEAKKQFIISITPEEIDKSVYSEWKEFRPPIDTITEIHDLADIDTEDILSKLLNSNIPKSAVDEMKANYKEYLLFNSLELIRLQNVHINKAKIENIKYHPTPLDNSCCLTEISNYNFYNYFNDLENGSNIEELKILVNQKAKIYETVIESPHRSSYNIKSRYTYRKLDNVSKNIFGLLSPDSDITNDDIVNFHLKYISTGVNIGKIHIFDKDGVCLITNEKKAEIMSKTYTNADLIELMDHVVHNRRITIKYYNLETKKIIEKLDEMVTNNKFLGLNIRFNTGLEESWIQKFREQSLSLEVDTQTVNELWEELSIFTNIDKEKLLLNIIDTLNLSGKDKEKLEYTINNFGIFNNINSENESNYYEKDYEFFESDSDLSTKIKDNTNYKNKAEYIKYCMRFMKKYLSRAMNNTSTRSDVGNLKIPQNWKIEVSQYDRLVSLVSANLKLTESINNIDYEQVLKVYDIVNEYNKGIEKLNGISDIYSCTNDPDSDVFTRKKKIISDYTHKNNCILLENLFINMLMEILNLIDRTSPPISENVEAEEQPRIKASIDMYRIVNELLKNMNPDNYILNEYSKNIIDKNIKTNKEKSKEDNLQFIADLDKEARQALMAQVKTGIIGYKDLAKNLRSQMLGDINVGEGGIHERAREALGEDATGEDLDAWISANREDTEVQDEITDGYLDEDDDANALTYD